MGAQVITLSSHNRAVARIERDGAGLAGFEKALAAVKNLHPSSMDESKAAIENWHAAELLSRGERDALWLYFGWERVPG